MKCTRASPLSDLWSLGVIVFMLVTGGFSPFFSHNEYKMQVNLKYYVMHAVQYATVNYSTAQYST